ncbi:MAG: Uma2 family endonuclease, partial [Cyclobacteriaceae bacterium]|nr:Uma2 family endonuclease [Cyclobacteriaceae bacterium]
LPDHQKDFITTRGIEGPPLIVVEIISPTNSYTDRNQKKKRYLEFGIGEYWIIDPANKTLEIYTPASGEEVPVVYLAGKGEVQSTVVKGLSINLKDIF